MMKAMAKEPERRYTTAGEMADDLRRFLADQPIHAHPPSTWDRAVKLAHRHRTVLMGMASVALVALVALGISSALVWQEQRRTANAEKEKMQALKQGNQAFDESFRVLDKKKMLINLSDQLTMRGMERFARTISSPADPAIQEFYRQALDFYEGLAREPSIGPEMQALALRRLGFTRMVSTRDPCAEDDYRRSIAIYESLLVRKPRDPDLRDGLADAWFNLGILQYDRGRMALAEPSFQRAIAIVGERAAESPAESQLIELLAGHHSIVSAWKVQDAMREHDQQKRRALLEGAEEERRALLEAYERLTKPAASALPAQDPNTRWAAQSYRSLARMMAENGWIREQEEALRRGLNFEPKNAGLLLDFANLLAFRKDADRKTLDEAVELAKKAAETEPERPEYWRVLALAYLHRDDLRSATQAVERSLKLQPPEGQASDQLVMAMVFWQQDRRDEAKSSYIRALDRMARHPNDDPDAPKYWSEARVLLKPILVAEHLTPDSER
jgi:tetratricopeptide (TPR) repeat protein